MAAVPPSKRGRSPVSCVPNMNGKSLIKVGLGFGSLALLCVACNKGDAPAAAGSATASAAAAPVVDPSEVSVGKQIIASTAANSFTEGKVVSLEGTKVTYEYGEPDKTTNKRPSYSVDKAKAFVVGIAPKTAPKAGDFIVAKSASGTWGGCEVKSADGGVLGCEDWYGKVNNVDPKTIVAPDAATAADIKDSLAKATKHRKFDEAAKAAGKPVQPAGWKPKAKDAVVVAFAGSSWYGGTVEKIDGEKVTIKWDSTVWKDPADKMVNELAPLPKAAATVKDGQFIIVQPKFAGSAWEYRKVVTATKDTAEVVDKDDTKSTVNLKEVIAVAP